MPSSGCSFCYPQPQRIVAALPLCLTCGGGFPVSPSHTLICPGELQLK